VNTSVFNANAANVFGEDIRLDMNTPSDTLAVQALVEQFDSQDIVLRIDEDGCLRSTIPAFVHYAKACAKLDGAVPILIEVLASERWAPGEAPPQFCGPLYSEQARLAAAVALEEIGPAAMECDELPPLLGTLLESPSPSENIKALAIIRGIGPDAASLLSPVRTLLYAENFHVQYWACRAVAAMGDAGEPAVADLCLLLLMDSPASVRRNACIALGEVAGNSKDQDVAARILIIVAQQDYSYPVRVEARAALKKFYAALTPCPGPPRIDPNNPPNISPGFVDPPDQPVDACPEPDTPTLLPPVGPTCG
jgi:HEAT repeat protein